MYTAVSPAKTTLLPFVGLCCLGIIGFLIAVTIVLALIPIYVPNKDITPANLTSSDESFFLQYSADSTDDASEPGNVTNTDEISQAMGIGDDAEITSGTAQPSFTRRRRSLNFRRRKRGLKLNFLFQCRHKYKKECQTFSCRKESRTKFRTRIQLIDSFSSITISLRINGVIKRLTFKLSFVGLIAAKPLGFGGQSSTLLFVAIRSGAFNDPSIWADGIVPYGSCTVTISAGVTVALSTSVLPIRLKKLEIYGTLALGSGSASFKFSYALAIVVRKGGIVNDLTSDKKLLLPENSLLTMLSGGGFAAAGTIIQAYSSTGLGLSVTLTSASGPFTCGILPGGAVLSYNKVTFIAIKSGGFLSSSTFLGGLVPSADLCSVSGCGLQIQAGVTLSTADLNGQLDININEITVATGAFLELGTSGSSSGFKFLFSLTLNVLGSLKFVASGGGIFIPTSSSLNFLAGGSFSSIVVTFIQVFNPSTGLSIGSPMVLSLSFSGPYALIISITGEITIDISGSGGVTTTTIMNSFTTELLG